MKKEIEIRRINSDEGNLLRKVRLAALENAPYAFGAKLSDELNKPLSSFNEAAQRNSTSELSATFLALHCNEPIGQIGAFVTGGKAFICAMWVASDYRRQKVGKNLFIIASGWLYDINENMIFAWVADTNEAAKMFYRELGFEPTEVKQSLPSNPTESETLYAYNR